MIKNNRGSGLILVIVVASVLIILGGTLASFSLIETKQSIRQEKKTQAHYIARAGAAATAKWITDMGNEEINALHQLTFPLYSDPQDFGEGTFELKIIKDSSQLLIESTGKILNGKDSGGNDTYITETVTSVLEEITSGQGMSALDMAIFSHGTVEISSQVIGNVGTNSVEADAVILSGDNKIIGDLSIGPGGDPNSVIDAPHWADPITGSVLNLDEIRNYPVPVMPDFPEDLPNRGSISLGGSSSQTISSDGYYSDITIKSNTTLTVDLNNGDRIIRIENLDIQQGHIKLIGSGTLTLYIDDMKGIKGSMNDGGDVEKLYLYYRGEDDVKINGGTLINGSIYVDTADIEITGGGKIQGDIISGGQSVSMSGGSFVDSKVVYAPNASFHTSGGATINGAVIANEVEVEGGSTVTLTEPSLTTKIPIITEGGGGASTTGYSQSHWK